MNVSSRNKGVGSMEQEKIVVGVFQTRVSPAVPPSPLSGQVVKLWLKPYGSRGLQFVGFGLTNKDGKFVFNVGWGYYYVQYKDSWKYVVVKPNETVEVSFTVNEKGQLETNGNEAYVID